MLYQKLLSVLSNFTKSTFNFGQNCKKIFFNFCQNLKVRIFKNVIFVRPHNQRRPFKQIVTLNLFPGNFLFSINHRRSAALSNRRYCAFELYLEPIEASSAPTMVYKRGTRGSIGHTPVRADNHGARRFVATRRRNPRGNGFPFYFSFFFHIFRFAGLETTTLGLEFRVRQRYFKKGDMKLKV